MADTNPAASFHARRARSLRDKLLIRRVCRLPTASRSTIMTAPGVARCPIHSIAAFWLVAAACLMACLTNCGDARLGGGRRARLQPKRQSATRVAAESLPQRPVAETPLERYLADAVLGPYRLGKMAFCATDSYGSATRNDTTLVHLWALCMAFDSINSDSLVMGTGASLPVVVAEFVADSGTTILGHWEPPDGEEYGDSISVVFPERFLREVFEPARGYSVRAHTLEIEVIRKAREYFGMKARTPEKPGANH